MKFLQQLYFKSARNGCFWNLRKKLTVFIWDKEQSVKDVLKNSCSENFISFSWNSDHQYIFENFQKVSEQLSLREIMNCRLLLLLLLLYQYISAKRVRIYIHTYIHTYIHIYIYIYRWYQTQQYDLKQQIKTHCKDPVEDILVLSAGTIFVIRQRSALKRDYWLTHLRKFRKILVRSLMKEELVLKKVFKGFFKESFMV